MNLFRVMEISGSALLAERVRAEVVAANLANAETTRTDSGGPDQRMHVIFGARQAAGPSFGIELAFFGQMHAENLKVLNGVADTTPPTRRFEPGHPDADAQGYV